MYIKTTHLVKVTAIPTYLEKQSEPVDNHYVWSYSIRIENQSPRPLQLRTRHWRITDANGVTQEVRGEGVVGEQPVMMPGGSYHYTSGAALKTPSGIMVGSYQLMDTKNGEMVDVEIPAFSLDSPHQRIHAH